MTGPAASGSREEGVETDFAQVLNQQIDTCKYECVYEHMYMYREREREREREKESLRCDIRGCGCWPPDPEVGGPHDPPCCDWLNPEGGYEPCP